MHVPRVIVFVPPFNLGLDELTYEPNYIIISQRGSRRGPRNIL